MSIISNRENNVGFSLALAFALLAAVHWLLGLCYSRGYDFFLWLYNAWLFAEGNWPNWSPYSAAGQPAFKMAGFTDAVILSLFNEGIGLEVGTRLYVVLLYVVAGTGMYVLARKLSGSTHGAVVASAAYSLSWFLTFTAYYQSYLSNFLSYALMPWCALFFINAIRKASRGALLGAVCILFISITSNAQVAIKVVLFVVPIAYVTLVQTGIAPRSRWLLYSALFGLFALWWSTFLVVPALMMREEVLLLGEARGNAFIAPWLVLFWMPLYGINFLSYWLTGFSFLGRDFLAWAVFSDYIGLSTLIVATASLWAYRTVPERIIAGLWMLLAGYFFVYFAIVPNMAASAWVGRTHNWAILPTLILALLAAFGMRHMIRHFALRLPPLITVGAVCVALVVDLAGVSFFLNRLALTHASLDELPEVGVWKELRAEDEDWGGDTDARFFTYNPDHTFYLLPVLMQKSVANIIELRSRNWEYDSYISYQMNAMREVDPHYNVSESLALLDVEYVDLARKLYDYRGDEQDFERGMSHMQNDDALELVVARRQNSFDASYDAYSKNLELSDIVDGAADGEKLSQVVYRNHRHFWGFVAEKTILLLGPTRLGQAFFEEVTRLPQYRADRLLFILSDSLEDIDSEVRSALTACITVGDREHPMGLKRWQMEDLRAFYERAPTDTIEHLSRLQKSPERSVYRLEANRLGAFIFISQQRFRDWLAWGAGRELPAFKAQAGMTAVHVPAGVEQIEVYYRQPAYEWTARAFSLLGFLVAIVWWLTERFRRRTRGLAPLYLAEKIKNGSSTNYGKTAKLVGG